MEMIDLESIFGKKYIELSDLEKSEMSEMFQNEDDFNQLKYTFHQISNEVEFQKSIENEPKSKTKEKLDNLFHKHYQSKGLLWYNTMYVFFVNPDKKWHSQNVTRTAVIALLALLLIPFMNSTKINNKQVLTAKNEVKKEKLNQQEEKNSTESSQNETISSESLVQNENQIETISQSKNGVLVLNDAVEIKNKDFETYSRNEFLTMGARVESLSSITSHPDGVFIAKEERVKTYSNFSLQANPNFLDLLTPAF
jgi:hypothetical protein